jgi:hypothetical protein
MGSKWLHDLLIRRAAENGHPLLDTDAGHYFPPSFFINISPIFSMPIPIGTYPMVGSSLCVPKIRFGVDAASGRRKLAS